MPLLHTVIWLTCCTCEPSSDSVYTPCMAVLNLIKNNQSCSSSLGSMWPPPLLIGVSEKLSNDPSSSGKASEKPSWDARSNAVSCACPWANIAAAQAVFWHNYSVCGFKLALHLRHVALEGLEVWTRLKRELPKEAETPGQELNPPCWPDRLKHSGSPGVWAQECPYRDSI